MVGRQQERDGKRCADRHEVRKSQQTPDSDVARPIPVRHHLRAPAEAPSTRPTAIEPVASWAQGSAGNRSGRRLSTDHPTHQ